MKIIVYGSPAPQGSKRLLGRRGGPRQMVESSEKVRPWRQDVKEAARQAIDEQNTLFIPPFGASWVPIDAPVLVRMVFTMPKPASAPKRKRTYPSRMPDLSKLARSTEDALTDAGIWKDDARVVEYSRLAKVYPGEDPEALDSPGVRIEIETL